MARVEYEVKAMLSAIDRGWSQGFKKASQDVSTFDAKTQNILEGASTAVGKTMSAITKTLGVGALAFGSWGLGVGIEFNKTMSEVEALTQESSEELLGELKAQALEIGEVTKFSANEVAEGYARMAQAGFKTRELLASMPGVTNLAAAANTNLAMASQMAATAINTFGLDPSETDRVADVYAQVASSTQASLLSMKDSMSVVGPDARALGYDIEQVSAAIGLLGDAGILGSRAGTNLRQVFNSMRNPTKKSLKSQDTLGIDFWDETTGEAKDLIEILRDLENAFEGMSPKDKEGHLGAIFGVRGGTAINALLNTTSEGLDQLTEALYNADGAAQVMAETMQDNLAGDIEKAGGAFESTGVIITDMLDGPLRRFFQSVETNVGVMNRWLTNFANLENNTERFWLVLMEVSDVLPTIGAGLGALGAVRIAPGLNNFLGEFANLGRTKWATMIDPLTGDTVKYQQEVTKLGQFFQNTGQKAQTAFTQAGAKLSNFGGKLATIPNAIWNWDETLKKSNLFRNLPESLQREFSVGMSGVAGNMRDSMSPITEALTNWRENLHTLFSEGKFGSFFSSDMFMKSGEVLSSGFSALKTSTKLGFQGFAKHVKLGGDLVQKTGQAVFKVAQTGLKSIGPTILVGALLAGGGILYEKFGEQIDSFVTLAVEKGPGIITGFIDSITPRIEELISFGADLLVSIADVIVANLPAIVYAGMEIITALANGVMDNMDKIIQSIVRIITVILTTLITAIPDLIILGMDILMSLVQGIIDNLDLIISSVILVIETLVNALVENLPTIITMGIGVLLSLIQGIVEALPELIPAITQAIVTIIETLVNNLDLLIDGGITLLLALIFGIIEALPMIMASAGDIIVALINGIVETLPKLFVAGWQLVFSLLVGIIEGLPELFTAGVDLVTTIWNGIWDGLQTFVSNIGNAFSSIWDWLTSGFEGGLDGLWSSVTAKTDEAGNAVTDSMTETSEEMIGIVEGTNEGVSTDYDGLLTGMDLTTGERLGGITSKWGTEFDEIDSKTSETSVKTYGTYVDHLKGMDLTTNEELNGIKRKWKTGFDEIDAETGATSDKIQDRYVENLNKMEWSTEPHMEGMGTSWKTGMDKIEVTAEESNEEIQSGHLNLLDRLGIATDNELDNMGGLWDAGYSDIEDTIGGYQSKITASTGDNYVQINRETAGAVEELSEKFETGFSDINTNTSGFVSQMSEAFEAMFDKIGATVDKGVTDLRTSIEKGLTTANTNAQTLLNTLIQTFTVAGGKFYTKGIEAGENYNKGLGQREYMITRTVLRIVTEMVETMTIGANMSRAGRVTAENYNTALTKQEPVITATARKIANSIISGLSIYSSMRSSGSSAGQGFYNGLNSWSGRLSSKARAMANSIVRETRRALDINSPSGVMETIGEQTGEGQIVGQENRYKDVVKQARRMANAMVAEPDKTYSSGLGGTYGGALGEVGHERQPVTLLVEMGGRAYKAFVQDIYNENDQNLRIEEVYGG